jgi:hypothetical protein
MMLSTVVGYSWQALMRRMMWIGSQERAKAMVTVVTSFTTRFRFWKKIKIMRHIMLVRYIFLKVILTFKTHLHGLFAHMPCGTLESICSY